MPTVEKILETKKLVKTFENFKFGPLDLEMGAHETLALFGHNGAGKSTFFQMITGQLDATEGETLIMGKKMVPESFELKRNIGYLPQNLELPDWVTGEEILKYSCRLYELNDETTTDVMELWACDHYKNRPLATCSHGMKKRIALALATIHDPPLLILDEPFSGLDVGHIRTLEKVILARGERGKATILCSHIIPYCARICERAVLFEKGQCIHITDWQSWDFSERIAKTETLIFKNES